MRPPVTRCRPLRAERLEPRQLLAGDWQNELLPLDVNQSGIVTPFDSLLVTHDIGQIRTPGKHWNRAVVPVGVGRLTLCPAIIGMECDATPSGNRP